MGINERPPSALPFLTLLLDGTWVVAALSDQPNTRSKHDFMIPLGGCVSARGQDFALVFVYSTSME